MFLREKSKLFSGSIEEIISMILGLLIVVVAIGLVFNFVKRYGGNVSVPGVNTNISINDKDLKSGEKSDDSSVLDKNGGKTYEVVYGDNLWKIAEKNYGSGYAWVNIVKENKIENPGIIRVGQKLTLPKLESKDIAKVNINKKDNITLPSDYSVVKGDSLWKIAVRTYGDGFQWVKIWQNNRDILNNPSKIEIGTKLVLPNLNG